MAETEAILLRRFARSHDAAAFAEITRRHAGLVYGAAWRILSDMDRAADVAQDTFLQLTKDAGTISGSLPGWLHRVATHKAIDARRREVTRRHREVVYAENQEREARDWKEISPYVDEGLRALDPELREMLIAHFLDGQTTRGIADAQGISQATVSRRVEAGVNQLRAILRKRGVIVAAGALTLLLGQNSAQAAPAVLMTELGKMALIGGGSAATGSISSLFLHVAETITAAVKANGAAVAAVAVIGVSSVVMYDFVSTSKKTNAPVVVASPREETVGGTVPTAAPILRLSAEPPARPMAAVPSFSESGAKDGTSVVTLSSAEPTVSPWNSESPAADGSYGYERPSRTPGDDPNDANDPNDPNNRKNNDSNSTKH